MPKAGVEAPEVSFDEAEPGAVREVPAPLDELVPEFTPLFGSVGMVELPGGATLGDPGEVRGVVVFGVTVGAEPEAAPPCWVAEPGPVVGPVPLLVPFRLEPAFPLP